MNLVIVESPTKARKLSGYLGKDFKIEASVGHVRDLPSKKLSIDIENNFEPQYEISEGKKTVVNNLTKLAKKADEVYLAMDPDREGEAIAWHVKHLLQEGTKNKKLEFKRSTFHEITKDAVLKAINNPSKLNLDLVDAQQARRVVDRLVGYKLSPVLWKKVRRGLSAGRVQSVALRLIVEREKEIKAFVPEEYWELDVALNLEKGEKVTAFEEGKVLSDLPSSVLISRIETVNGKKFEPKKKEDVTDVETFVPKADYTISSIERKARKRKSLAPFTTSTMQQTAATRLGFTSKQTMTLAQQLYEEGLITYHRTDSVNLSKTALDMARKHIPMAYGAEYLPAKPRIFSGKSKNAQEAHEAIRVTDLSEQKDSILQKSSRFTENHVKLYDLIWRRFVASQMATAVYDQTALTIVGKGSGSVTEIELKTTGSILKFDGWMKLFPGSGDRILPDVQENQELYFNQLNSAQKFTQPPSRYNDASVIKELEKKGIGRPSTYASIISVIVNRGYVERQNKRFFATPVGITVCDFLMKHFKDIMDYDFTAEMEEDLDRIARGEKDWRKIVKEFYTPLEGQIEKVVDKAERMQVPVEKTGEDCPTCLENKEKGELEGEVGEIVIRTGKFGKFKSCSKYPDCKFTENIVITVDDVVCPLCQKGDVIQKNTRWGKPFFGCGRYPDCDWASWKKPEPGETITKEEWKIKQEERKKRAEARKARFAKNKKGTKATKKTTKTKKKTTKKKTTKKKAATKKK